MNDLRTRTTTFCITLAAILLLTTICNAADRPNIILMMSDDQGWGDVGYNGHKELKTPHLDQMAKEGITFNRFYSANAMCSPTRGSVYTGRHPYRYGITFAMKGMLEPNEICITTVLKKAGYTTGHFGKWHMGTLSKKRPDQNRWGAFAKNPQRYYCPPWERDVDVSFVTESKVPTWDPMINPGKFKRGVDIPYPEPGDAKPYGNEFFTGPDMKATTNLRGDDSRVIMDRAIPFIEGAVKEKKPFLAVIWFHTPRSPVVAGPPHRNPYKDLSLEKQHYYGCLTAMDEQIGRLRASLNDLGIADNTMVTFCSDNGPARQGSPREVGTAAHLRGRKLTLLEGGIRVPGLLVWPKRFPQPKTINTPVVTTDYFPTILAVLDIPLPDDRPYDGTNILPLIEDPKRKRDKGIGFLHAGTEVWMKDQYKLIGKETDYKLYDIDTDPGEKTNLANELPEVYATLKKELDAWTPGVFADLKSIK